MDLSNTGILYHQLKVYFVAAIRQNRSLVSTVAN